MHVINETVEKDFVAGLVTRTDAKLPGIVDRLAGDKSEIVLSAGRNAIHEANHIPGTIKHHRNVVPLPVIHNLPVSSEYIYRAGIRFMEGCSQRAIAGNAHTPTIRVGAADPSHFCHHHPRGSGLDPGRHRPITGAGVQASARSAPDERIRSKHVSVRTVASQSVIGNAGYVRRAGYSGIMAVSGQIKGSATVAFIEGPVRYGISCSGRRRELKEPKSHPQEHGAQKRTAPEEEIDSLQCSSTFA